MPHDALPDDQIEWRKANQPEPPADFDFIYEEFVQIRRRLFPSAVVTGANTTCRMCGDAAAEFVVDVCVAPVAYCQRCLTAASTGLIGGSRQAAARAVGLIGEHEFGGQPMLETQLDVIHVDPATPVAAGGIDRLLLLRFAVRRGDHAWTHLLAESGLINDGMRMARGTILPARDHHLCLSLREKVVDDFLHQQGIAHDREPLYPYDIELNPRTRLRADWILEDGALVEMWGMPDEPNYAAKMAKKKALAKQHRLALIGLTDKDLPRLTKIFERWITGDVSEWTWSPLMVTHEKQVVVAPKRESTFSLVGVTGAESARDRLARCRRAIELRAAGYTRAQMVDEMGVQLGTLKVLLRDGAFYDDPDAKPERLARAELARKAKKNGNTKEQFMTTHGSTRAHMVEAWRDAEVLWG